MILGRPGATLTRQSAEERLIIIAVGLIVGALGVIAIAGAGIAAKYRAESQVAERLALVLEHTNGLTSLWDRAEDDLERRRGAAAAAAAEGTKALQERLALLRRHVGASPAMSALEQSALALQAAFQEPAPSAAAVAAQRELFLDAVRALRAAETARARRRETQADEGDRFLAAGFIGAAIFALVIAVATAALMRDYGRRRDEAEALFRERDQWIRTLVDSVPGNICYVDTGLNIVYHNRSYRESLGKAVEEIQGRHSSEVLDPGAWLASRPYADRALAGETVEFERTQTHPDGTQIVYQCHYVPNRGATGRVLGFYGLHFDVTALKELEQQKSEFISVASHELRTPLTAISGALTLLVDGLGGTLPEKAAELARTAQRNAERLGRLVNDLLDLQRMEAGRLQVRLAPVEPQGILDTVAESLAVPASANRLRLEVPRLGDDFPRVLADPERLHQVLSNLVSNACRYSFAGTPVELTAIAAGSHVRFELRNRGPGIPEDLRPHIFGRFVQARRQSSSARQGSSGLGLAICKGLVEQMGGRIGFESKPDELTVFHFEIPVAERSPGAPAAAPASQQALSRRG